MRRIAWQQKSRKCNRAPVWGKGNGKTGRECAGESMAPFTRPKSARHYSIIPTFHQYSSVERSCQLLIRFTGRQYQRQPLGSFRTLNLLSASTPDATLRDKERIMR